MTNHPSAPAIHAAADALVDHAHDVFWRTDSGFAMSSRYSYESAAAWLHQHAVGVGEDANPDDLVHLFAPHDDTLAACRETDVISTAVALEAVTCGWCRVEAHKAEVEAARSAVTS
ncbi:hypothetical protein [Nocardioides sp. T2.26MG-1]|uniref:hypothetical protein n=1 Tax=Nocardioides sp. T2.26MG-1 TaxID=3041166 RepID=UPI0024774DD5|nr:hypothetical protein [Nocardioides sp. T2.26MG-1]CAI9417268.1 hypothetical protein HIDPHFAB_02978 [Nocardioides sp. T2.26MG-1]